MRQGYRALSEERIAALAGLFSLAMVLGAMGFQYIGGVLPCEMCYWQRWPYEAAVFTGIGGALLSHAGFINKDITRLLAWLSLAFVLASGLIGAYQAGVEWQFLPGPASCTGPRFEVHGNLDLSARALDSSVVRCDVASWRLFGLSLAGYNALWSFAMTILGALLLTRKIALPLRWVKS